MNRFIIVFGLVLTTFSTSLLGQLEDEILLTVNGEEITAGEFIRVYSKNNNIQSNVDPKTVEEYLDLYINFKLKVHEAENRGLDTLPKFVREFNQYKEQLIEPYLRDKEYEDSLLNVAYYRTKNEIDASHILLKLDKDASPADTARVYNRIMEIRQEIVNGGNFEAHAARYSEDPSAVQNNGRLGYFRAFQMVYPFEDAAYNTKVGEISMPVRTDYGYHLIKVNDIRPSDGSIRAAHIWFRSPETFSQTQQDSIKALSFSVYEKLQNGEKFEKLAAEYSDDKSTASKGGEIPEFTRGRFIPEFTDAAFAIENPGDYTEPLQTQYGWHIIKLIEKKPVEELEVMKDDLAKKIKRVQGAGFGEQRFLQKLKEDYNFVEYVKNVEEFYPYLDSNFLMKGIDVEKVKHLDKPVFSYAGKTITQKDLVEHMDKLRTPVFVPNPQAAFRSYYYKRLIKNQLMGYYEAQLPEMYPEYKYLLQEYHDGIILFDLTDTEVWSKAVNDTTGLEEFFKNNRENYKWDSRVSVYEISYPLEFNKSKELKKYVLSNVKEGKSLNDSVLTANFCDTTNSDCIKFAHKTFEQGDSDIIDNLKWKAGKSKLVENDNNYKLIVVHQIHEPSLKELNECRGLVISDYQNKLEKEWIADLRSKYEFSVNDDVLNQVKSRMENKTE